MTAEKRDVHVLLVEDVERITIRAAAIGRFSHDLNRYLVKTAKTEEEARRLIEGQRFEFMLVDLLLRPGSSKDPLVPITDHEIDDERNGVKVARRLLKFHRDVHKEQPSDPHQLRPIIYSASQPSKANEQRIRFKILCSGAYDFISKAIDEAENVLQSLGDMCDLQEEMQRVAQGKGWISHVFGNLGCGIDIIDRNCKIWYCSPKNATFSGLDLTKFHDKVCWVEYHGYVGRLSPCPECPAVMTIRSEECHDPKLRDGTCITERFPFESVDHPCDHLRSFGYKCSEKGESFQSFANVRLARINSPELEWIHLIASPIYSRDKMRVIGAVETVVDLREVFKGYWDARLLSGRISAEKMLRPALNIVNWLGYARAQVFRLSKTGHELLGVAQVGGQLDADSFADFQLPKSELLPSEGTNAEVVDLVEDSTDMLGRRLCQQAMVLGLHAPGDTSDIVGSLVIDDVVNRKVRTTRTYKKKELKLLQPVARYAGRILELRRQHERQETLQRQAENLRRLEAEAIANEEKHETEPLTIQAEAMRRFLAKSLRDVVKDEPNVIGFHLRFPESDGRLRIYREDDPFSKFGAREHVSQSDPDSLSARCFRTQEECCIKANDDIIYRQFFASIDDLEIPEAERESARKWCDALQKIGWFPISFGRHALGTLVVQSRSAGFLDEETAAYMRDVCNLVARVLGRIEQLEAHHLAFWENTAYAFRGPVITMLDIAALHWRSEEDPLKRDLVEGEYALAQYLYARATSMFRAARNKEDEQSLKRDVNLGDLWRQWCALIRGLSRYGSKKIEPDISDERVVERLTGITIKTDPTLLTEIVFNVFENAWKACREKVMVSCTLTGRQFVMDIKDDGPGISESAFMRIWQGHHEDFEYRASRGWGLGMKWSKIHADSIGVELLPFPHGGISGGAHLRLVIPLTGNDD